MPIEFPNWVKTTKCVTRTFSMVLPAQVHNGRFYHANHITYTAPVRPTKTVMHLETGKLSTAWADAKYDSRFADVKE